MAETNHYLVVDKPALLDSQNSKPGRASVVEWLQSRYGYAGLVHRLDFGTSGLMVCAKTSESARQLATDLQAGRIKRSYLAVVIGKVVPSSGTLNQSLDDQQAITHYRVRETFANATLLEVDLETGRKHQIRKHFSALNHPLLGDHLYGKRGAQLLFDRPALHAFQLIINGIKYTTEIPSDIMRLIQRLKATRS